MKCTLMPGIESISGSIKGANGSRLIFKTYKRPSANRKSKTETRVYISHKKKRTKPLSANEIVCRARFAEARGAPAVASTASDMSPSRVLSWRGIMPSTPRPKTVLHQ